MWIAKILSIFKEAEVLSRRLPNFGRANNFFFLTIKLSFSSNMSDKTVIFIQICLDKITAANLTLSRLLARMMGHISISEDLVKNLLV